jgi:putative ABC transport system ATP-binding protein
VVAITSLSYKYPEGKAIDFQDFTVGKGDHTLLLGESGCGKTTLLHLLGGLLRGAKGNIKIKDVDLLNLSESELDKFRKDNLGFIFQKNHLITALDVQQNLLLASHDKPFINDVLASLNIDHLKHQKVTRLSHGQAQRVAIARSLVNKPSLILADEPTSALDDRNSDAVIQLLLQVADKYQSTLVIATHDSRLKSKINRQIKLG